ncbi:AAA-like domain-containing protein [Aetokthonos hydrillicola Thurmond2011]|jgi:hypothetical protein|uniref:AAA-like domain-containing protein n=1 Tax=Aetokthonos hydrillicola Thurmond2011 TaxID=2712845 RepID=A0AAP5ICD4_9CYAN|nr:AAA-like domain-containing protein [Aetokthonos hydrillicola]MBO3461065.1 serine/threonine protein kinase [Aetokthonos hydrillicola CCALA 1050]MBW4586319.1 AAA-like domain-containing protein [Aetokthonos hydrillicola CCALA 1050]MDR9897447.1 AAA-like domain-containing protein [Aetokthonos hydrillicola Thurmond2011]
MDQETFDTILEKLTKQEEKVLRLFLEGKDDRATAEVLYCTQENVRAHLANICKKFYLTQSENTRGCSHRDELIILCCKFKPEWVAPLSRQRVGCPSFEYPNGRVPLESYFYLPRNNIELHCSQAILQSGALIRIKAPKLMGKTSLMTRIFAEAKKKMQICAVEVNLAEADREKLDDSEKFLRWFCTIIGEQLGLEQQLINYWKSSSELRHNCTTYFERYLLPQINCPLVLGLDEVERIFPYAVAQDFLTLLRLWHEKAKTSPIWGKLRLIISHSTEVYVKLKATQSPFNVGEPIELSEFSVEQIKNLAIRHGLGWADSQVDKLMMIIGGHPYLIRLALYHLATQSINLEQLLRQAPTEAGIYRDHLRGLLAILRQDADLAKAYKTVVTASSWVELDPMKIYLLWSMGLVSKQDNKVMPRCHLYHQYFRSVL